MRLQYSIGTLVRTTRAVYHAVRPSFACCAHGTYSNFITKPALHVMKDIDGRLRIYSGGLESPRHSLSYTSSARASHPHRASMLAKCGGTAFTPPLEKAIYSLPHPIRRLNLHWSQPLHIHASPIHSTFSALQVTIGKQAGGSLNRHHAWRIINFTSHLSNPAFTTRRCSSGMKR